MGYYLGLDGGGTKTRCRLADETTTLAEAEAGSVKLMAVEEATATARVRDLVRGVCGQAGIDPKSITMTCFGLAGVSIPSVRVWAERALRDCVGNFELVGDEEVAFEAVYQGGPGVLVVAGTGAIVMGRCSDGTRVQAGGWGPMLGDEGSGQWIGMEAIRAGLRAVDRGVETCLLRSIEQYWGLATRGDLVAFANARSRPDFAELTTVVAACAEDGDALAASVLERAGKELAEQVGLAASKMHQAGCSPGDASHVAFTGSVLGKIPRVRRAMVEALAGFVVAEEPVDALNGAVWRARRG